MIDDIAPLYVHMLALVFFLAAFKGVCVCICSICSEGGRICTIPLCVGVFL